MILNLPVRNGSSWPFSDVVCVVAASWRYFILKRSEIARMIAGRGRKMTSIRQVGLARSPLISWVTGLYREQSCGVVLSSAVVNMLRRNDTDYHSGRGALDQAIEDRRKGKRWIAESSARLGRVGDSSIGSLVYWYD